jgi:hypothetical protein
LAYGSPQVTTAGSSVGNSSCILFVAPSRGKTPLVSSRHRWLVSASWVLVGGTVDRIAVSASGATV